MVRKRKAKEKDTDPPVWCFYCDRVFGDETSLLIHQKEKHWRCPDCKRKMHSAAALQVHSSQVHKNNLSAVPFAKPGRGSFDIEVFGMAGIPAGMKRGVDGADAGGSAEHSAKQQRLDAPATLPPPPNGANAWPRVPPVVSQPTYSQRPHMMQPPPYPVLPPMSAGMPPLGFHGQPPWGLPPGLRPPGMPFPPFPAPGMPPHAFAPPIGAPMPGAAPQLFPIGLQGAADSSQQQGKQASTEGTEAK